MRKNRIPSMGSRSIDTKSWITLRWTRGNRYYRVHLEQDLWSDWLLTQVNGRIGTRLGRARSVRSPSIEAALLALAAVAKRRRQRGYLLTS
jgi:WGR domain